MFSSREDAGVRLGQCLKEQGREGDIVLGLPRGGVIVAAGVARALGLPLEVLAVRKIGHPFHREFALGAIAEPDVIVLDESQLGSSSALRNELEAIITEEREQLRRYQGKFHRRAPVFLAGKRVILVDDGLATGATTEAAVLAVRKQAPRGILVAVPVASDSGYLRLRMVSDEVIALLVDPDFAAVGNYYRVFTQTTDEEVLAVLE